MTQTFINRIMSYLPKASPLLARKEVVARMNSYYSCWKISINDWREYNGCSITPWHETWYNEAELCRRLNCTEEEAKSLIMDVNSFILIFVIPWMPSFMNQLNGVLLQKKDGDSCTVNPDEHCFIILTS